MNKQKTIPVMALVGLISLGLAYTGTVSAHERGHHKEKQRVEQRHHRHDRDGDRDGRRVIITSKKVKRIYRDHEPRRHHHRKHRHDHDYGRHLGWYLDRHYRHGHPKKWRKMKRHLRRHHHEHRNHHYDDDGRVRFHIEYSSWL